MSPTARCQYATAASRGGRRQACRYTDAGGVNFAALPGVYVGLAVARLSKPIAPVLDFGEPAP
jgi:hypothetical protein